MAIGKKHDASRCAVCVDSSASRAMDASADEEYAIECGRCGDLFLGNTHGACARALETHARTCEVGPLEDASEGDALWRKCSVCDDYELSSRDKGAFYLAWSRHMESEEHRESVAARRAMLRAAATLPRRRRETDGEKGCSERCELCRITIKGSGAMNLANNVMQHERSARHRELAKERAEKKTRRIEAYENAEAKTKAVPLKMKNVYDALERIGSDRSVSPSSFQGDADDAKSTKRVLTESKSAALTVVRAYLRNSRCASELHLPTVVDRGTILKMEPNPGGNFLRKNFAFLGRTLKFVKPVNNAKEQAWSAPPEPSAENFDAYLNLHSSFCAVVCGKPGSGVSHTLRVLTESCLVPAADLQPEPAEDAVMTLEKPMTALAFASAPTDADDTTFRHNFPSVHNFTGFDRKTERCAEVPESVGVKNSTVFTSPWSHGDWTSRIPDVNALMFPERTGKVAVKPLLFAWDSLTRQHLRSLLGLKEENEDEWLLRLIHNKPSTFQLFYDELEYYCKDRPLLMDRAAMLKTFVHQNINDGSVNASAGSPFEDQIIDGTLHIIDLKDPAIDDVFANGVCEVALSLFRKPKVSPNNRKVVLLHDAEVFLSLGGRKGFANELLDVVRTMHQNETSVVIGTNASPANLPEDLLAFASLHVVHSVTASRWLDVLFRNVHDADAVDLTRKIQRLYPGEAVMLCAHSVPRVVRIRNALTAGARAP